MTSRHIKSLLFVCLAVFARVSDAQTREIYFVSDTQQPMGVEEVVLHPNHNIKATSLLLADMRKQKPLAIYMLGDVVALGSSEHKWRVMDRFLDSCRKNHIPVHALLGNHDLMWTRERGEKNFQRRFPDNVNTGYVNVVDSIAIILLNSNFNKLSAAEIDKQQHWYTSTLDSLDSDPAIVTIIVACHHAPFSNSRIVGSSTAVQRYFVPAFLATAKCHLFITGHAHAFEYFSRSGKNFLVIGGGGGLHQPLDTSGKRIPDIAFKYKPMFHYLSMQRKADTLFLTSHFLKTDFSGIEKGYTFELDLANYPKDSLLGDWTGTSKCQVKNSPCHDENVVFHLSPGNDSDQYKVRADRIVDGQPVDMGELNFTLNRATQTLTCVFPNGTWVLVVNNKHMDGTLTTPDNVLFRKLTLSKAG